MSEKIFNSRIIHKHDIEAHWLLAVNFVPKQGEIIVYDIDSAHNYERVKIGDGKTNVNALPFYAGSWNDLSDRPFGDYADGVHQLDAKYIPSTIARLTDIPSTDTTLSVAGAPADAKTIGDTISSLGTIVGAVNGRVDEVNTLIGDTSVSDQISSALDKATADDFGVYVQDTEPTDAVAGDIWVDTANDPAFIEPNLPEVTASDNGKVLMVVNGKWQAVNLNLSIDANGVVYM